MVVRTERERTEPSRTERDEDANVISTPSREPEVIDLREAASEAQANGEASRAAAAYQLQLRGSVWHKVAEYGSDGSFGGTPVADMSPVDAARYALEHGQFEDKAKTVADSVRDTMRLENYYFTLYRAGDLNRPVSMDLSHARAARLGDYINQQNGTIPISITDDDPGGAGLEAKF